MADVTTGPDAQRTNRATTSEGPAADLSTLSVARDQMQGEALSLPRHTATSVVQKWGAREFDGGATISGRLKGGAA